MSKSASAFRIATIAAGASLVMASSAHAGGGAVNISIGEIAGAPGDTVPVDVTLSTGGFSVAGTQNDITTDTGIAIAAKAQGTRMVPDCTANPDINKTGTSFAFQPSGCTPGTDCTGIRALVLSLSDVEPIPDGSVLYSCKIAIASDAAAGDHILSNTNTGSSDPDGQALTTTGSDGRVTVGGGATDATIIIGNGQVDGGGTSVSVDVTLETGTQVAGTQNDIEFAGVLSIAAKAQGSRMVPDCTPNAAINKGGTSFAFQPSNCTPGTDCTGIRALVLSLSDVEPIPTGSVLYSCKVDVADTEGGDFPLPCANPGSSDPNGGALSTDCMDGTITVGGGSGGTPTTTPTNTPPGTGGTPTSTPTGGGVGTPTATRTGGGGGGTPTRVPTQHKSFDDDGCAIVAPAQSGSAWMLLLPAAALLWLRRRSR